MQRSDPVYDPRAYIQPRIIIIIIIYLLYALSVFACYMQFAVAKSFLHAGRE
jgi:hypothetical protein